MLDGMQTPEDTEMETDAPGSSSVEQRMQTYETDMNAAANGRNFEERIRKARERAGITSNQFPAPAPAPATPKAGAKLPAATEEGGAWETTKSVAGDVATGMAETLSGRAPVHGAVNAVNAMLDFTDWIGDALDRNVLPLGSFQITDEEGNFSFKYKTPSETNPDETGIALPNVDAPESTTGKLVSGVSQFLTGFVSRLRPRGQRSARPCSRAWRPTSPRSTLTKSACPT